MAEPEGLLIEGARLATASGPGCPSPGSGDGSSSFWVRSTPGRRPCCPPAPVWLARLTGRAPRHLRARTATAATGGASIWLPRVLDASDGKAHALAAYRLLAVEQAARAARHTPGQGRRRGRSARAGSLPLLAEAIALDPAIAGSFPGLVADLLTARKTALAERPPLAWLTPAERAVERLLQKILSAEPSTPAPGLPLTATPSASRAWAGEMAQRVRAAGGRYRSAHRPGNGRRARHRGGRGDRFAA